MKLHRVLIVLVVLAASLSGIPAEANHTYVPPIDRSPLPELAGRTTILGDRTGWMRVRLPAPIDPNKIDWVEQTVEGRGRAFGALMFREKNGEIDRRGADLSFTRFGQCSTKACKPQPYSSPQMWSSTNRERQLPAGIYRLYLLTDGAPVKVYFSTPQLPGVVRLNPSRPGVQVKVQNMTPRLNETETGFVFSAGDRRPFGGEGISMQAQWVDPIGAGFMENGICIYEKEAPADQRTAYLPKQPGCPAGVPVSSPYMLPYTLNRYTPLNDGCCWGLHFWMDGLPKAMGNWLTTSGPVEKVGATAVWLNLD